MTDLLELVILNTFVGWALLALTIGATVVLPKFFGLNALNALSYAQMMFVFNAVTICAGVDSGSIGMERVAHFYILELGFLAIAFAAYRRLIGHRARILAELNSFFAGRGAYWMIYGMAALALFNLWATPTDGQSRIGYMTASWYSLIKPVVQLSVPLAYLGVFVMLMNPKRRRLGFVLLALTVAANVLTGSKASFIFSLLTAFLALRDLTGRLAMRIRSTDKRKIALAASLMAVFALQRLEVSPADVVDRFMLYGEATILTYFSETPTEACTSVSTLASMHRGVARALGDPSANDIDTLFGFALMKVHLGMNTLTGPNGRLSAYFLCNFPGERVLLGCMMIGVYFAMIGWILRRSLRRPIHLVFVYPFIVTSFGFAAQDFNLIMADITVCGMLLLTTIRVHSRPGRLAT